MCRVATLARSSQRRRRVECRASLRDARPKSRFAFRGINPTATGTGTRLEPGYAFRGVRPSSVAASSASSNALEILCPEPVHTLLPPRTGALRNATELGDGEDF